MPVEACSVDTLEYRLDYPIAKPAGMCNSLVPLQFGKSKGFRRTHYARYILRTRPALPLLPTAGLLGLERSSPTNIQNADAFGAIELVGRKAEHVYAQRSSVQIKISSRLDRIRVHHDGAASALRFRLYDV